MNNNDSFASKLFASGKDALNPLKLLVRLAMFFVFGIMTALPYLIFNLNQVQSKVHGETILMIIWSWLRALSGATFQGMMIGLSTVWDSMLRVAQVIGNVEIGTMLYVFVVLLFVVWATYQPVAVLFDIADLARGQHFNKMWALLASLVIVLFMLAPIAYAVIGGATITSGIKTTDDVVDDEQQSDTGLEDVELNETNQPAENQSIVNSLNMLVGG